MKMSSEFGVKLFDTHPEVQVAVGNGLDLGDSDGIPWQKRPGFAGFFLSWRRLTTTLSSRLTSSPCNTIQYHGIPLCLMVQSLGDRLSSNIRQIKHGRHFIVLLWDIHIAWTIL